MFSLGIGILASRAMAEVLGILQTGSWMMPPRLQWSTLRQMKAKQHSYRSAMASAKTCFRTPSYNTYAWTCIEKQELM